MGLSVFLAVNASWGTLLLVLLRLLLCIVFFSNQFLFSMTLFFLFLFSVSCSSSFQDERYSKYIGKQGIVPLTFGRHVPIISDKVELYIIFLVLNFLEVLLIGKVFTALNCQGKSLNLIQIASGDFPAIFPT